MGDDFLAPYAGWGATHEEEAVAVAALKAAARSFLRDHPGRLGDDVGGAGIRD